ncbi:MarR family winged helix-turn-helix transcriptional regulator [Actinophytocola algeriensis]|uniref:DNA-binding MarR family transcriptional regulator n=1 Tax=Actinophytocola algeriensis TaxID=1768010 RepID=A0A7W7VH28_9PSEU|nr:MarR family transcriptional regulator [Actinophytocola algeriensis]MBB4909764.1 DNA-binding MarR family transcriptional regulator [Actinophytocola algeriensis]MBE1475754.1 DNA-binding MarR family transcriptional regulator [Actinophytocola algeriensis]
MKYVHDDRGLYDPAVRETMGRFAEDTTAFEAAAAVRAAAHAVERLRAAGAEGRALSSGAVDLLLRLSNGEPAGVGELARAAGVSSRNVTGLVDTLEKAGMVVRAPDPADRRAVLVSITEGGLGWLDDFREPARLAMAAVFHGFSADDVAQLRDLCLRLVVNQRAVAARMGDTAPSTVD